jgi:hypothetical protein
LIASMELNSTLVASAIGISTEEVIFLSSVVDTSSIQMSLSKFKFF